MSPDWKVLTNTLKRQNINKVSKHSNNDLDKMIIFENIIFICAVKEKVSKLFRRD